MWPRSWNSRSFCSTTVWPRWMSGAVGIEAELDAQRPALLRGRREALLEAPGGKRLGGVAGQERGLGGGIGTGGWHPGQC